ncbi:MAG: ATP-binding protein, partial [Thiohalocapsa sp.]
MRFRLLSILVIGLIQAALLALPLLVGLNWLAASNRQQLTQRGQTAAQMLALSVRDFVRAAEFDRIPGLLESLEFDPEVAGARVFGANDELIATYAIGSARGNAMESGPGRFSGSLNAATRATAPIVMDQTILGRVDLALTTERLDALMARATWFVLSVATLQVLLAMGFSALSMRRRRHQLEELQRGAERIALEGPGVQLQEPQDPDLGRVARALNHMSQQLADSYAALREALTESHQLMGRITESERQKHRLVETALDGIVSIDGEGRVLDYNPSAERLFGYAREEIVGRPLDACIAGSDLGADDTASGLLFGARDDGIGRRRERSLLRKDGRDLPLEITATRWRTDQGEYRTAFMRDISDRKRYEDMLEENAQRARDASEAKSRFLASMSHEIRTPLNAILNMNELLLETGLDDEQRGFAATASDSASALLSIVNAVLDFSKIEAGRVEPAPRSSDPEEIVKSVIDLLAARASAKDVQLTVFCDPAVPLRIETAPGLVRQILLNLVGNAIKFTHEGAVRIQLALNRDGDTLRIGVVDTGIGIAAENQADLFDEFVQADQADSRKYGGSGLGLAISRRLARALGGDIELTSALGEGSCFALSLPLTEACRNGLGARADAAAPLLDWQLTLWLDNALVAENLADQLGAFGLDVTIEPPLVQGAAVGSCGEVLLEHRPGATSAGTVLGPRRVALYQIGTHCPANVGEPGRAIASLRIPVVPSDLIARLVQAAAATSPVRETTPDDDLAERVTRCAASATTVLLAEDSRANQLVATTILTKAGFRVDVAENGLQAVAAVNRRSYGLVLMDVAMPEMDGLEATGCIRALPGKRGRVPIVAMTANAFDEDRQRCLDAGMDDYLTKPVERMALYRALVRWLDSASTELQSTPARAAFPTGSQTVLSTVAFAGAPLAVDVAGGAARGDGPLDETVIAALVQDLSNELMPAVVATFIDETEQRILSIERAAALGNAALAGEEGHAL